MRTALQLFLVAIFFVLGTVLTATSVRAQQDKLSSEFEDFLKSQKDAKQKRSPTPEEAVDARAVQVRRKNQGGQFDAYVKQGGTISSIGTKEEMFSFEKCMNAKGRPLEDRPK